MSKIKSGLNKQEKQKLMHGLNETFVSGTKKNTFSMMYTQQDVFHSHGE
jgi:hypothetical protein